MNKNAIDAKGIDILLTHRNRFDLGGKPFFYEVGATMTYSKTRWLKYNDEPNVPEWQKVTGYRTEPWHIRYVGPEHARLVTRLNVPYEIYMDYMKLCWDARSHLPI